MVPAARADRDRKDAEERLGVASNKRIQLRDPLGEVFVSGSSLGRGMVHDLSLGGLFMRSPLLPPAGASIVATLTTPTGDQVAVRGTVQWNTATTSVPLSVTGFGVRVARPCQAYIGLVSNQIAQADQS